MIPKLKKILVWCFSKTRLETIRQRKYKMDGIQIRIKIDVFSTQENVFK